MGLAQTLPNTRWLLGPREGLASRSSTGICSELELALRNKWQKTERVY